jgi:hypothetical protein
MDAKIPRRVVTLAATMAELGAVTTLSNVGGKAMLIQEWDDGTMVLIRDGVATGSEEVSFRLEKAAGALRTCRDDIINLMPGKEGVMVFPAALVPLRREKSRWRSILKTFKPGFPASPAIMNPLVLSSISTALCTKTHCEFKLAGLVSKGKAALYVHEMSDDIVVIMPLGSKMAKEPGWLSSIGEDEGIHDGWRCRKSRLEGLEDRAPPALLAPERHQGGREYHDALLARHQVDNVIPARSEGPCGLLEAEGDLFAARGHPVPDQHHGPVIPFLDQHRLPTDVAESGDRTQLRHRGGQGHYAPGDLRIHKSSHV